MEKILEALGKVLPENQVNEVASAVKEFLTEAKKELEAEAQKNLEEAYKQLDAELKEAERIAEEGYAEAAAQIQDRDSRIESMKEEFEAFQTEQYQEAWKMIQEAKAEAEGLESAMYEEYDSKLDNMKNYIVDKVDQFLKLKGKEIYESAYRDALNDPQMAEHKVVLDKIVELAGNYISTEDVQFATGNKLEEATSQVEKLTAQVRIMEGRNIRLSAENTKIQSQLNESIGLLKEFNNSNSKQNKLNEQKERVEKAGNVQGSGHSVTKEEIIKEFSEPEVAKVEDKEATMTEFNETFISDLDKSLKLAGYKK